MLVDSVNSDVAEFVVWGLPAPQGSKGVTKTGKVYEMAKGFRAWRNAVVEAATQNRMERMAMPMDGYLILEVTFYLPRPNSTKFSAFPAGKPDLSKLLRNTEDGLTQAGLITDDARFVDIVCKKRWGVQGAVIRVTRHAEKNFQ